MRGDKEIDCLNFIIQSIFYNKNGEVRRDFNGKSYLDVDDETFKKWCFCYVSVFHEVMFGLTKEDETEVLCITP